MDRLDIAALRERDECWWEEIDLTCPFCKGEGHFECDGSEEQEKRMENCQPIKDAHDGFGESCMEKCPEAEPAKGTDCATCEFADDTFDPDDVCWNCEETIECEECTEGRIEILWNTGFGVYVSYTADWEEMRKLACNMGFALIKWDNVSWLLMSMCGLDCTWMIHYTRWKIQGYLTQEDIQSCLSSGGHVFLSRDKKEELCQYFKGRIQTPDSYAEHYERDLEKLDQIVLDGR